MLGLDNTERLIVIFLVHHSEETGGISFDRCASWLVVEEGLLTEVSAVWESGHADLVVAVWEV